MFPFLLLPSKYFCVLDAIFAVHHMIFILFEMLNFLKHIFSLEIQLDLLNTFKIRFLSTYGTCFLCLLVAFSYCSATLVF